MKNNSKAVLYALLAVLMWSTVAVPFKFGLKHLHFIWFLFVTISIAVIVSFGTIIGQQKLSLFKQLTKKEWGISILGGFLNPFLYYLILFKAYAVLPAQIAQALNYTWPIMLVLLSVPFLGQKIHLKSLITLLLGFLGVYFIASQGQPWPLKPAEPLGVFLALISSVVWALFWILNTKSTIDVNVNLAINFSSGLIFTIPLLFFVSPPSQIPVLSWMAAIYAGFFEMGITFVVWLTALKLATRSDSISNFVFLSPFISLLFIFLFLHEKIFFTTLFGLILIIISIFANKWLNKSQPHP